MFPQIKYASDLSEPEMIPHCICDIKTLIQKPPPTAGERDPILTVFFVALSPILRFVSEAAQSLTLSLLTPGHWRK